MKLLPLLALFVFFVVSGSALAAEPQNLLTCPFFSVALPDDWKAVTPPEETAGIGMTKAHFANTAGTSSVVLVVGSAGGLDTKTIAQTYAQQYKAPKDPVENNGQFTFSFSQQKMPCQAWVTTQDDMFMVTVVMGNQREGLNFVRKHVKSADYPKLLPR